MTDLIKQILKENVSDEQLKSDIQFIIDEDLVDIEVYPDMSYLNREQLYDIFPGYDKSISRLLVHLGYGAIYIVRTGERFYYNTRHRYHNINGPAIIYPGGNLSWYVNGNMIAVLHSRGVHNIFEQEIWDKYFAKNYNQPINENSITQDQFIKDVQWVIDEDLVDMEVYPDITYINLESLNEIFPGYKTTLIRLLVRLGYGEVYIDPFNNKSYYNTYGARHNKNGPAAISSNGYKEWFVNNRLIAKNKGNHLNIIEQSLWDKYFAKKL